jgi:lysophospholipase L1-like esterase
LRPNLDRVVWDYTVVSTNAQRIRRSEPLGSKRSGAVRIVCLGDSVTFGFRVPLVFPSAPYTYDRSAAPYPNWLERHLRAANPGRSLEVVNLAVPGYSSRQGLALLEREIGALAPDLVLVCFGWNDVSVREQADADAMPMGPAAVLTRRLVGSSQLLLRASLALRGPLARARGRSCALRLVPRVDQGGFVANVLACAQLARSRGARAVVLGPLFGGTKNEHPDMQRMADYRRALREAAERAGVPFFERRDFTEAGRPDNQGLFPVEPIHPGERGHELYAEALLRFLAEEGILASLGLQAPGGANLNP